MVQPYSSCIPCGAKSRVHIFIPHPDRNQSVADYSSTKFARWLTFWQPRLLHEGERANVHEHAVGFGWPARKLG